MSELVTETSEHVDALLPDHPARKTFLDASAYYSTASRILDSLQNVGALRAALSLRRHMNALGQARSALQAAERALKQAAALVDGISSANDAQAAPGGEVAPPAEFGSFTPAAQRLGA